MDTHETKEGDLRQLLKGFVGNPARLYKSCQAAYIRNPSPQNGERLAALRLRLGLRKVSRYPSKTRYQVAAEIFSSKWGTRSLNLPEGSLLRAALPYNKAVAYTLSGFDGRSDTVFQLAAEAGRHFYEFEMLEWWARARFFALLDLIRRGLATASSLEEPHKIVRQLRVPDDAYKIAVLAGAIQGDVLNPLVDDSQETTFYKP